MPFDMVLIDKDGWNKEKSPALHCILKELRRSGNEKLSKTHPKVFLLATSSSTETAEFSKAALAKLRPPHNFDACFMDLQMPEMDGFEATRQVRCIENDINKQQVRCIENDINKQTETSEACSENLRYLKHWHTPILAMIADVIQATHEKCMKCGMDGYVSKPFEEGQFYNAVMHFFESEQSSPSHET